MNSRLDEDPEYINILKVLENYHKDPIGLTKYLGTSVADNTYPKQLNTIIGLLVRLHRRLDQITSALRLLDTKIESKIEKSTDNPGSSTSTTSTFNFEHELQNISLKLSRLKVDKGKGLVKKEPQPFGKLES